MEASRPYNKHRGEGRFDQPENSKRTRSRNRRRRRSETAPKHEQPPILAEGAQMVWSREAPDQLIGIKKESVSEEPVLPKTERAEKTASKPVMPEPSSERVSETPKNEPKTESELKPEPKTEPQTDPRPTMPELTPIDNRPAAPVPEPAPSIQDLATPTVDYRRFFWEEADIEPKTTVSSHDILPPTPTEPTAEQRPNFAESLSENSLPPTPTNIELAPDQPSRPSELPAMSAQTPPSYELGGQQVIDIAKSITIDDANLYDMYLAKRIDAEGLHNVVVEHLRGHDVQKALTDEIIQSQLKFERDPQLRHIRPGATKSATAQAVAAARARLGQKVNKEAAKKHARTIHNHGRTVFGFYRHLAHEYPLPFQIAAIILGVFIYILVLVAIIRA